MEMHTAMTEIAAKPVGSAGPILFSLVMSSWHKYADSGQPSRNALFPGYPRVRLTCRRCSHRKASARQTSSRRVVSPRRIFDPLLAATQKYLDNPADNPLHSHDLGARRTSGQFQGSTGPDMPQTSTAAGIKKWYGWASYNMPGPDGINRSPSCPKADGSPGSGRDRRGHG